MCTRLQRDRWESYLLALVDTVRDLCYLCITAEVLQDVQFELVCSVQLLDLVYQETTVSLVVPLAARSRSFGLLRSILLIEKALECGLDVLDFWLLCTVASTGCELDAAELSCKIVHRVC